MIEGLAKAEQLKREATQLFEDMGLRDSALFSAWAAFEQSPEGTVKVALNSFEGHNPGGLFLYLLGRGYHKTAAMNGGRRTGYRFVRGSHGGTYVRDPRGTDSLPTGYQ